MDNPNCWTDEEIKVIAEDIKRRLAPNGFVELEDLVDAAREKSVQEIGFFQVWVAKHDRRLREILSAKLVSELSRKVGTRFRYDPKTIAFVRNNAEMGVEWLAGHLYTTINSVGGLAERQGRIKIRRMVGRTYSAEEDAVICNADLTKQRDKDIADLIRQQFGVYRSADAIRRRRESLHKYRRTHPRYEWNEHPEADAYLIEKFGKESYEQIAIHLGLEKKQVMRRAVRLGLTEQDENSFRWKDHPGADEYLIAHYKDMDYETLGRNIGVTGPYIARKVAKRICALGLKKRAPVFDWTPEKDAYLIEHNPKKRHEDIGKDIGATLMQIRVRTEQLGLRKYPKRIDWADYPEEDLFIGCMHQYYNTTELSDRLGIGIHQVRRRVKYYGAFGK